MLYTTKHVFNLPVQRAFRANGGEFGQHIRLKPGLFLLLLFLHLLLVLLLSWVPTSPIIYLRNIRKVARNKCRETAFIRWDGLSILARSPRAADQFPGILPLNLLAFC